jgi:hypothetical protein
MRRLISAQVAVNMLAKSFWKPYIKIMVKQLSLKAFATGLLAFSVSISEASATDQAKAIVNTVDSKSMNELLDVARRQPDAALTNIAPVSANTFRFLFIWPASNTLMTTERVGRSFVERFSGFADQLRLLAKGFCLTSRNMYFGTAAYGEEEVNVAYRDIEVHFLFGRPQPCTGHYITIAEIEESLRPSSAPPGYGASMPLPEPPKQIPTPEEGLKPFFNPQPPQPME